VQESFAAAQKRGRGASTLFEYCVDVGGAVVIASETGASQEYLRTAIRKKASHCNQENSSLLKTDGQVLENI
jgi:hypothetical protein